MTQMPSSELVSKTIYKACNNIKKSPGATVYRNKNDSSTRLNFLSCSGFQCCANGNNKATSDQFFFI